MYLSRFLSLSCLHVGPSLAPQSRLWGTVTSGIEWDGMDGWLLAAAAGCRCPRTWLLLNNVLYSRHVFHAKQKNFLLLFFSPLYALVCSFQCQYSLIRASEW